MAKSIKNIVFLFFLFPFCLMAQLPFQEWINLARTDLATASVSSVNGDRGALNRYYGAANLFDGGINLINQINYDYWLSEEMAGPHTVELSFSAPVDVYALMIELRKEGRPLSFSMAFQFDGEKDFQPQPLGPISLAESKAVYAFPETFFHIRKIRFLFDAPAGISIAEIAVLGKTNAEYAEVVRPFVEDDGKLRPEAQAYEVEIDSLLDQYFHAVSGRGKVNWDLLESLCVPNVQFLVMGINKQGENIYHPGSLEEFTEHMTPYIKKHGFFQRDAHRQIEQYYRIAHVWSHFESRNKPKGEVIDQGRISFQLVRIEGEWKIGSVMWNSRPGG